MGLYVWDDDWSPKLRGLYCACAIGYVCGRHLCLFQRAQYLLMGKYKMIEAQSAFFYVLLSRRCMWTVSLFVTLAPFPHSRR